MSDWWVNYYFTDNVGRHGPGVIRVQTTSDYIPIGLVKKYILDNNEQLQTVLIQSWTKLSKSQAIELDSYYPIQPKPPELGS